VEAIDYDRGAAAYERARTLPPAVLEGWRRAVGTLGTAPGGRALDLGCGTGQSLGPLADWLDAMVVGVEPSAGMRDAARPALVPGRCSVVAGRAEALPLARGSVGVAWLSTVVHQIDDLGAATAELRRVVTRGGRVLIRGFFGDRPLGGYFRLFPGAERAAATFPTTAAIVEAFGRAGFGGATITPVGEDWGVAPGPWAARARTLRHVDSALRPLTDEEFAAGIAAVEALADAGTAARPAVLHLDLVALEG